MRSAISPRFATSRRRMGPESRHDLAERLKRLRGVGSSLPRLTDLGGGTKIAVRLRLGVALVVAAVLGATAGTARAATTALIVTGHGWGHGVGLSQWGAYGYALHGWKYRRILAHYYPGTKMSQVGEMRVRVLLTFDGREYHGTLALRSQGGGVSVVNGLPLDTYLRGVVPSESPSHWPLAALEAQAVAARSYAVAELRPSSWYDLVPTTAGQVARTYYSSSSGGRTEAVQDAWPGSAPIPYLRSVPDPYDSYSPHHDWGPYNFSASTLADR